MNWISKLFTQNLGLKLLSLALALALWAAVGSDPVTEANFRVPVEFTNVPRSLELLTEQPTIQLWARGPSHSVRQAGAGDFAVRVNAGHISRPGENTFSLDPARVVAPTGLQVVEVVPSEIRVIFERTASKEVPIQPQFSGQPMPGYRVTQFSLNPPRVRITGPSSHVEPITMADTDPVDLSQLSSTKTFTTSVFIPDPLVRSVDPKTVRLTVEVEESSEQGGQPATSSP